MTSTPPYQDIRLAAILDFLRRDEAPLHPGELTALVARTIARRASYLKAAQRFGTPQYLLEEERLAGQVRRFTQAFNRPEQPIRIHYAFKAKDEAVFTVAIGTLMPPEDRRALLHRIKETYLHVGGVSMLPEENG